MLFLFLVTEANEFILRKDMHTLCKLRIIMQLIYVHVTVIPVADEYNVYTALKSKKEVSAYLQDSKYTAFWHCTVA